MSRLRGVWPLLVAGGLLASPPLASAQAAPAPSSGKAGAPQGAAPTAPIAPAAPTASGASGAPSTPAAPVFATERRLGDLHLVVHFPDGLRVSEKLPSKDPQVRASWAGKLGASDVTIQLVVLPRQEFGLDEPSEVTDVIGRNLSDVDSGGDPQFHFAELSQVSGPYGFAAYATLSRCTEPGKPAPSQVLRLTGLLEDWGYALTVRCQPALADADLAVVRAFLVKGLAYDGPVRDAKWSTAEAKERWESSVQDKLKTELDDVLRTPHYIILTNSSGGKAFAKKMEECYAAIRKVFPFDEVPERRLMPVFLFRTNDQYYDFFAKSFHMTVDDAKRTGGVASGDFYTTWYEAPGDPVHIHEATHQIFRNRLGLGGGGSWFQEGVAEYICTKDNERGAAAHAVDKGKATPLAELMRKQSLIFSSAKDDKSGGDVAGDQYKQAALFIEFMHDSKFGKAKFLDWIHAVGVAPANDVPAIEAATRRIYGVDLAAVEKEFIAYCRKR